MNKLLILTIASACSAALLAGPVSSKPITVTPEVSRAAFVEKVSKDLDRQLEIASRWYEPYGDGIAIVRFTRDADGEPANIKLYRKSGNSSLDRTAMGAVDRLDLREGAPTESRSDQLYQANIIFARSERVHAKLAKKLASEEAVRLAKGESGQVLAFGVAATRPSS